jgi:serine/threonine protein kinase
MPSLGAQAVLPLTSDPLVGSIIDGKYQIAERIGSGGMGTVYKAVHISLGAPRAVKVMRRELAGDPTLVARFRDEARMAEGLRHPNLVALFDFGQLADGGCYIVSALVEGASLATLLKRRGARFASADVSVLMGQIADGLTLAHRRGTVHRDISPDNIMLTAPDGELSTKLLDFGIAKDTLRRGDPLTGAGWNIGKVGFSSPEQLGLLEPGETVDLRSDVFSLAAVAYLLLAGRLPWRIDSLQSYTHDLLLRPEAESLAEMRTHVAAPWRELFADALSRARASRIPDMPVLRARMQAAATATRAAQIPEPPPFAADMLRSGGRAAANPLPLPTSTLGRPVSRRDAGPRTPSSMASIELGPADHVFPAASPVLFTGPVLVPAAALPEAMARLDADLLAVASPKAPPEPLTKPGPSQPRLVLLDDDEAVREIIPDLLADLNLAVTTGPWDGDSAAFAAAQAPDLLLLDIGPVTDGAIARVVRLRDHPRLRSVPVVLFSSADEWTLRAAARRCSAMGYLQKSCLGEDLAGTVRRFFRSTDQSL